MTATNYEVFPAKAMRFVATYPRSRRTPRRTEYYDLISDGIAADRPAVAYWAVGEVYRAHGRRSSALHFLGVAQYFAEGTGDEWAKDKIRASRQNMQGKPRNSLGALWRDLLSMFGLGQEEMESTPEVT